MEPPIKHFVLCKARQVAIITSYTGYFWIMIGECLGGTGATMCPVISQGVSYPKSHEFIGTRRREEAIKEKREDYGMVTDKKGGIHWLVLR